MPLRPPLLSSYPRSALRPIIDRNRPSMPGAMYSRLVTIKRTVDGVRCYGFSHKSGAPFSRSSLRLPGGRIFVEFGSIALRIGVSTFAGIVDDVVDCTE